jgi:GNAT superfamily N-acetyltransferase
MDEREVVRAAHRNMTAFLRRFAELTEAAAYEQERGALLVRLGADLPFLNEVVPLDRVDDPATLLDRAEEYFAGRAAGFVVFTREGETDDDALRSECRARGFAVQPRYPSMVCAEPLAEPVVPPGCELRLVDDEAAATAYWDVCGRAYPSLGGFTAAMFAAFPTAALLEERTAAYVAHRDGQPLACALAWLDDEGVASIAWVATVEEARGTGLGAVVTARATNAGFERGARLASLQASPMGYRVYERLGYREVSNYQLFTHGF